MTKAVIVVDGGLVRSVVSDIEGLAILVVDRDVPTSDRSNRLLDVLDAPAAVDAAEAVEVKFNPGLVERAFREVKECLDAPGIRGEAAEKLRKKLGSQSLRRYFDPDTCDRITHLFSDAGFTQVKVLAGAGNLPQSCEIYLAPTGEPQRCAATLEFDGVDWTATVYSSKFDGSLAGGGFQVIDVPMHCSSFTAASFVLDYFDNHAEAEFKI